MFQQLLYRIEKQFLEEKPFVVYRKPGQKKVKGIFQSDSKIHYCTNFKETGFIFAPFDEKLDIILIPQDEVVEALFDPSDHSPVDDDKSFIDYPAIDIDAKSFHVQMIDKAISEIKGGVLQKVVLSRQTSVPFEGTPLQLFLKLLNTYSDAFCYMWYHPSVGLWLGATPETLVSVQNKQVQTMSLAGTQPYTGDPNPVWKRKEIEEQSMVTNYITNALKSLVTEVKVSETESLRAGRLMHLRTKITGRLMHLDIKKLVAILHPTPAVGGIPRDKAYDFIMANENYNREYYTGYLGELNFKDEIQRNSNNRNVENNAYRAIRTKTDLFVNLRSMKIVNQKALIFIGGGITIDSVPELEWEETVNKSTTMLKVIQNRS